MVKKINLTKVGNFISIIKLQQIWTIDELLKKVDINYDELLYSLTILSDIGVNLSFHLLCAVFLVHGSVRGYP